MPDERTLAVYETRASDYADAFGASEPDTHLRGFIDALPAAGRVLDLGCGPANASAHMREAGLDPDPIDATPAMVALANERHGIGARLGTFDDLHAEAAYDGVWANFSLLHAPRADLPRHLAAIARALKPSGLLHIGMKTGGGDVRDDLGRAYTLVAEAELTGLLEAAGFKIVFRDVGRSVGFAGSDDPWVIYRARLGG